jgi:hypothetical protein
MNFQRGFVRLGVVCLVPALLISAGSLILAAKIFLTLPPKTALHLTTKSNSDVTLKSDGTVSTQGPAYVQTEFFVKSLERIRLEGQIEQNYQFAGVAAGVGFFAYVFCVAIGWILSGFSKSQE